MPKSWNPGHPGFKELTGTGHTTVKMVNPTPVDIGEDALYDTHLNSSTSVRGDGITIAVAD